ncbi:auxin efflux carrier [Kipferlia bialata]|uniref:Auxin efflux carrier n=1 Tax=Kipferlia bialata TaxID=797122 RepID=A0A9K3D1Z1_9EUKA|nr:auxin efflux carrier [Kipferlia bialata]|eukprot:g8643.t1
MVAEDASVLAKVIEVDVYIFIMAIVGAVAYWSGIFTKEYAYGLNRFSTYIAVGGKLYIILTDTDFRTLNYTLVLMVVVFQVSLILSITLILRVTGKLNTDRFFSLVTCSCWRNHIAIGMPVIESVFGSEYLFVNVCFSLVARVMLMPLMWTVLEVRRAKGGEPGYNAGDIKIEYVNEEGSGVKEIERERDVVQEERDLEAAVPSERETVEGERDSRGGEGVEGVEVQVGEASLSRPEVSEAHSLSSALSTLSVSSTSSVCGITDPGSAKPSMSNGDIATLVIKRVLLHPMIVCTILGITASVTEFNTPDVLMDVFTSFGGCLTAVGVFVLGTAMATDLPGLIKVRSGLWAVLGHTALVLVVGQILFIGLAKLFKLDSVTAAAGTIMAGLPLARTGFSISKEFHVAEQTMAGVAILSLLLYVAMLPLQTLMVTAIFGLTPEDFA